ncbi:MAG TPA: hypothetical protein PK767_05505 [Clostridiales bacterium]|nr:hypothetical protein [Clostridiales bacterium]HPP35685.1 hypothetical protein [Clostridiales bacterium]
MHTSYTNRFQRNFMIFVNEDSGFEEGGKPSGYIKLEIREGKGKLETVIHNLKEGKGKFLYALYLVRQSGDRTDYVRLGDITHTAGRAEFRCGFDPMYVGGLPYPIDQYDIAAVVVEYGDGPANNVICPLAAYRRKAAGWRNGLRKALQAADKTAGIQKTDSGLFHLRNAGTVHPGPAEYTATGKTEAASHQDSGQKKPVSYPFSGQADPRYQNEPADSLQPLDFSGQQEHLTDGSAGREPYALPDQKPFAADGSGTLARPGKEAGPETGSGPEFGPGPGHEREPEPETEPVLEQKQEHVQEQEQKPGQELKSEPEAGPEIGPGQEQKQDHGPGREAEPKQEQKPEPVQPAAGGRPGPGVRPGDGISGTEDIKDTSHGQTGGRTDEVSPPNLHKVNTDCVYLNGNICDALVNNRQDPDPCGSCRINQGRASAKANPPADIDSLEYDLDLNFEVCDPFRSRRSDYKWWKVTNPVNLNNILYQNNIRSPLMFNPAVMLAHYRYKHLIIGIFRHKNGRKYVVCGVPGKYAEDMKPFGEMNTWVQAQGTRPRYGAFGYWLVYIDPSDGKVLHPYR